MRVRWGIAMLAVVLLVPGLPYAQAVGEALDVRWQRDDDRRPIPLPAERPFVGRWWDFGRNTVFRQIEDLVDLPAWGRDAGEMLGLVPAPEAWNVNAWDEVPDSTWYENRILRRVASPQEMAHGGRDNPPRTDAPWRVVRGKPDGITPGFVMRDADDTMYFVKFDVPAHDGLGTGAEVVGTLLMHAAGYWTSQNYIVDLDLRHLTLDPGAKMAGEYSNEKVPMRYADLRDLLRRANIRPDGTVRVVASPALPGRPVGTFAFEGRRRDDPNDRIPHEHRRELRAYRLLAAWLNNNDVQEANTLDMYVGAPGEGHIRHHLLDFSSAFGATGTGTKSAHTGHAHILDYRTVGANLVTFGFRREPWEGAEPSPYAEVGLFDATRFDPARWRSRMPNAAFERMTDRDAYWAARIVVRFRDEHLRAVVAEAKYPTPAATEYVAAVLAARRDAIARYAFARVAPLDDFTLTHVADRWLLTARDLALDYGYADVGKRHYRVEWRGADGRSDRRLTAAELHGGLELPHGADAIAIEVYDGGERVGRATRIAWRCAAATCRIAAIDR